MGSRTNYSIGELCTFAKGASIPRDRMLEHGDWLYIHYGDLYKGFDLYIDIDNPSKPIPFVSSDERSKVDQFVQSGDIIYVLTSETVDDLGHAFMVRHSNGLDILAGTETTVMRVERKDVVLPSYLNYILQTNYFKRCLRQYVTGMKVFRVHPRDISRIEISLPPIAEQRVVVDVLDTFFDKFRLNSRLNDYLEELFSLQYEHFIEEAPCKYVPLTDVIFFQEGPGIRNWQYVYDGNGVNFINIRCIQGHDFDLSNANQISTEEAYGKYKHFLVDPGDILVSSSGTLGRYAIARPENLPLCMNTSVIRFKPLNDPEAYAYVYGYLTSQEFYNHLTSMATGSAQVNFGPTHLKKIDIPLPSDGAIHQFNHQMKPVIDLMTALHGENGRLAELRDVLLPKLMSGEIDVSKVDVTQLNNHLA